MTREQFNFRIDQDLLEKIRQYAKNNRTTATSAVKEALYAYFDFDNDASLLTANRGNLDLGVLSEILDEIRIDYDSRLTTIESRMDALTKHLRSM